MNNLTELARTLSAKHNQPESMWSVALAKTTSLINKHSLETAQRDKLAHAANSPRQLLILVEYVAKEAAEGSAINYLFDRIDESPFSLTEWLEAIETFYDWISARGRKTSLTMVLGYISCSSEAHSNDPSILSLRHQVKAMLDQFGFDG